MRKEKGKKTENTNENHTGVLEPIKSSFTCSNSLKGEFLDV